jgi:tellurite resistance-related uncharacterized protein
MAAPEPYKATPVFDQDTLPEAIRSAHNTKGGVWGLLRVFEGEARLVFHEPRREVRVTPDHPAQIDPEAVHHVELDGPVRMQVEFYREPPLAAR